MLYMKLAHLGCRTLCCKPSFGALARRGMDCSEVTMLWVLRVREVRLRGMPTLIDWLAYGNSAGMAPE